MNVAHAQDIPVQVGQEAGEPGAYIAGVNTYEINQLYNTDDKTSYKVNFSALLADRFGDSGVLEVVSIKLSYAGTADKQTVMAAVAAQGTNATIDALSIGPYGHYFRFTNYNLGPKTDVELPISARLSRRIRGVDQKGMPAIFWLSASAGMKINVNWKLQLHGSEIIYEEVKV